MGEAPHQDRGETAIEERRRRYGGRSKGRFWSVKIRASAIPWRKSEPDVFISPSCHFAGAQFPGDARRTCAKLELFRIQPGAGSEPSPGSKSGPGSRSGTGSEPTVERRRAADPRREP